MDALTLLKRDEYERKLEATDLRWTEFTSGETFHTFDPRVVGPIGPDEEN